MANVYVWSGAAGAGTGADWTNAYTTLGAATTAKAAGDDFWVAQDHAETAGAAKSITFPGTVASPNRCICVNRAGTVPPVAADLRTTATISTTGNFGITLIGTAYVYGITFNCGSGANAQSLQVEGPDIFLDACNLALVETGAGFVILGTFGGGALIPQTVTLNNTPITFAGIGQSIKLYCGTIVWQNTTSAVVGTVPTNLIAAPVTSLASNNTLIKGVDLSAVNTQLVQAPASTAGNAKITFADCRLNSTIVVAGASSAPFCPRVELHNCDDSTNQRNYRQEFYDYSGNAVQEITVIRTGGASNGTKGYSWKAATNANAKQYLTYFELPVIPSFESITGGSVTATIETLTNAASILQNNQIWLEVEYLGQATYPLGAFLSNGLATVLTAAANLTASTAAWDSQAAARQNTHAYSLGDVIKTSSTAGSVFFCTTAGTSSGSEPGGYTSAADGASITDGTAVFRANMRQKLTVSFTPNMQGYVKGIVRIGAASTTIYVDPLMSIA